MATLLIDVLRAQVKSGKFTIHDFVVMPDHVHILLTTPGELTIEKAVQLIKGTFSFRANKELGFPGEVWQKGFSELLVTSREIFLEHRRYIEQNPVKAGLVTSLEKYPYSSRSFKALKASMAKS